MLEIKRFIFGPFETNTYVVSSVPSGDEGKPFVLLVDPACSNEYEQQQLARYIDSVSERSERSVFCQRSGLSGEAGLSILATHGHLDHLWGAKWATERWKVPVLMHEADIPMAKDMQSQYALFGIRATPQPFPIENLSAQWSVLCQRSGLSGETGLSILHTPGHTPGSVCLYFLDTASALHTPALLSGDTLFRMGYGRTDLPGGDMSQLISSLRRLATLPPQTQVFPGHGDLTTIGSETR